MKRKATYRVIPNFEILDSDTCFLRYPSQEERGRCVGGVSLICVGLDYYTLVHVGRMTWFVFTLVVWVYLSSALLPFISFASAPKSPPSRPVLPHHRYLGSEQLRRNSPHDPHRRKSRNCLPTTDDTQFPCNHQAQQSVQQKKGEGSIQHLDAIHFPLLHYRIESHN